MEFVDCEKYKNEIGIYGIINLITNKVYVGQTKQSFMKRYWHHKWKLNNNSHDNQHLQKSWNKYGCDSFCFKVLYILKSNDNIDEKEMHYIEKYRKDNKCYNILDGGNVSRRGIPMSGDAKAKVGKANRIKMTGRIASETTKLKMSKSRLGKPNITKNTKLSKEVVRCIKTKLIQGESMRDISKELNIDYPLINNLVSNNTWKSVVVNGWDDYLSNRKTYHRLSKEQHEEIFRLYNEKGYTKEMLAKKFDKTTEMIRKIIKKHSA